MPTVLVVDDNPMALELVREVLEPEGYELLECRDPREAMGLASGADIVILDVMMPEISGLELLKTIREDPELRDLPVLMLSALDEGEDRADGLEVGADDYLGKPFHPRELVLRLQKLLEARRPSGVLLEGELGHFAVGNILQQLLSSGNSGLLELPGDPPLRVMIQRSKIMGASLGKLVDREALLEAISIREGHFIFREAENSDVLQASKEIPLPGLMMEAAWLQDELRKRMVYLPDREQSLEFRPGEQGVELPAELAQLEIQEIADWLAAHPGETSRDLEDAIPLAPLKVRLALAWLVETEFVQLPESTGAEE